MNKLLTNKTKCLLTKQGIEIWIDDNQAEKLSQLMNMNDIKIIEIEGETISVYSIEGIFNADKIYEQRKRKTGQWQCEHCKRWHPKFEECGCQGGRY
ncbi:hypothetical protein M0R19_07850 [Candidatus Pacearchaeota archaeon]|nr:hypothetical protein [Candidatus Pacearchaeota archaeon]